MYRIIGADQKEYGPVSADQLNQWIAQSRVNRQTKVKPEGAADWQMLGELPEFAAVFTSPGAAPAPQRSASYADNAKTSGIAVTSLVLGILGILSCGLTSLIGLILGIVAMVKIKNSDGQLKGNGLAIAGVCVSGLFLLMIPIWAAMLLPALAKAKQRAQAINCVNNAKQIALAIRIYSTDNSDQFPYKTNWCDAIQQNIGSPRPLQCPASPGSRSGYAFNEKLDGLKAGDVDPQTVMIFESTIGWNGAGGAESLTTPRHGRAGGVIVGFADGSVQRVQASQLGTLRWDP